MYIINIKKLNRYYAIMNLFRQIAHEELPHQMAV